MSGQGGGPQNLQQPPMCPSPSAHSDSSSGNGRLSSAGSEPGTLLTLSISIKGDKSFRKIVYTGIQEYLKEYN